MMKSPKSCDYFLLVIALLLSAIGMAAVLSASAPLGYGGRGTTYTWFLNQVKWLILGMVVLYLVSRIDYHWYRKVDRLIIILVILSLLLVFAPRIGRPIRGVHRWIVFGSFQVQPSELAKLGIVIYLASALVRKRDKVDSFASGFLPYFIIVSLVCVLVTVEPDLGSAIIIGATALIVLYAGGVKISHMLYVLLVAAVPLYYSIFEIGYRKDRIMGFLDPHADRFGIGFQPLHLKMSLGSGGLFGMGPGQGRQKLFYLPTPHTDSIFAVFGEEFGFIGTSAIVLLFVLFTIRGLQIARRAEDDYGKLIAIGLTCLIGIQALINMGVATVLLPTTGSALPFISYGGSSLLTTLIAVGILLSVSRYSTSEEHKAGMQEDD
jgi:cell division protein FtsW